MRTHFTPCQHLNPPFQLPPCPQNIFHPMPTPQTPFSTAPMPSKRISHPVPTPPTPFPTPPMPSKHISPSAKTSHPFFNCPHAVNTYFTQCQHLKSPFQLPPCPQNIFHTVPTPQTPFSIAPMPSKHISPSADTSNPPFNSKALQNAFSCVQHPQNRHWGPTCDHSGPQNTVFGQKMVFCWPFLAKKCVFLVMAALKLLIVCSRTFQNTFCRAQHPENRVWAPTADHSGAKNAVLGQEKAFLGHF